MLVVKVGGGDGIHLEGVASDLAGLDRPVVVVHGGNARRDELAERLGIPKRTLTSSSGVESVYSDEQAVAVLTMAYAGLVNKRFVSLCLQAGVRAVGLSGLDGAVVRGRRNRGIRIVEEGRRKLVRDLSGKAASVNLDLLSRLLDGGYTPLLTVPIADEEGVAINTENDDVVALLQRTAGAEEVVQLIEAPGLLRDRSDPASLYRRLTAADLAELEAAAGGRYKRKLMALRRMMESGCRRLVVADGRRDHPLRNALRGEGTVIE